MDILSRVKDKVLSALSNVEDYIDDTTRVERAMSELRVTPADTQLIQAVRRSGIKNHAMTVLGITEMDLDELRRYREEAAKPKLEQVKSLIGDSSSFHKFITLAYLHYTEYKKRSKAKWKIKSEFTLTNELVAEVNDGELTDQKLFSIVLKCFFLHWKKNFSRESRNRSTKS